MPACIAHTHTPLPACSRALDLPPLLPVQTAQHASHVAQAKGEELRSVQGGCPAQLVLYWTVPCEQALLPLGCCCWAGQLSLHAMHNLHCLLPASSCTALPLPAEEAEALKGREGEHWEKAKAYGEEARRAGKEEMQHRLGLVGAFLLVALLPLAVPVAATGCWAAPGCLLLDGCP